VKSIFLIRLIFRSSLHIGTHKRGIKLEATDVYIHSDTIFSSIINSYSSMYGKEKTDSLIENFSKKPLFKISSAFPYTYKNGYIYYLPKPADAPPCYKNIKDDPAKLKVLRETTMLPLKEFKKWATNESIDISKIEIDYNNFLNTTIRTSIRPINSIDRLDNSASIYHCAEIQFENGGLYLLLSLETGCLSKDELIGIFTHMGKHGIGGRRTHGYGQFVVDKVENLKENKDWEFVFEGEGSRYINLSLYYPCVEEGIDGAINYKLINRGGYSYSSSDVYQVRKREVNMFQEGSVFSKPPIGCLLDITPPKHTGHRLYKYGYSLNVSIK